MTGEFARLLSADEISVSQIVAATPQLLELTRMLDAHMLSSTSAKEMLLPIVAHAADPKTYARNITYCRCRTKKN